MLNTFTGMPTFKHICIPDQAVIQLEAKGKPRLLIEQLPSIS